MGDWKKAEIEYVPERHERDRALAIGDSSAAVKKSQLGPVWNQRAGNQ
jgi:hypothetical protein